MAGGESAIEDWTLHCPACDRPVEVRADEEAVACPHCHAAFAPETLATAARRRRPGASVPPDPDDEMVGRRLGRWQLTRLLGRGGMGRVYEARESGGKRRVALKVLSDDLARDPSFVKRFHREARVLASLTHPHVVEILDGGEDDGRLWFAMEYIRGENLRRRLERGTLPAKEVVRLAGEIASALAFAHERGVVHRDLKPENVLLDEEDRVHLVDFGLSRLAGDGGAGATTHLTRTDVILGTYEYMAPEQRRGDRAVDARADVFALGVMLYEMLTGTLPLGRFTPPSQARSDIPPSFDGVVNRALATDPGARYPTARAFQEGLQEAWSRRGTRRPPPPTPAERRKVRPPDREYLDEIQLQPLRRVLRHVDILAALDRVLGFLLLAGFFGIGVWTWLDPVTGIAPELTGVVLLVAGILFLHTGGKLSRMHPGSRDSQLTASVLLLFFPPFLTLMGVYGLVALSGDRARRAFAVGRKALEGPRPVVRPSVIAVAPRPRLHAPWLLLRILFVAAILWTLYVGFVAVETGGGVPDDTFVNAWNVMSEKRQLAAKISIAGAILSLAFVVLAIRARHTRRGLGLAITAFVLFLACSTVLTNLHRVHALAAAGPLREAPWSFALPPPPPQPRLEIPR